MFSSREIRVTFLVESQQRQNRATHFLINSFYSKYEYNCVYKQAFRFRPGTLGPMMRVLKDSYLAQILVGFSLLA